MLELLVTIGILTLVILLLVSMVSALKANRKANQLKQDWEKEREKTNTQLASLKKELNQADQDLKRTAESLINNRFDEIVNMGGSFSSASSAVDKIIEKIISLLDNPHGGFTTQFVKTLAGTVAEKIDLTGDLFTSILKNIAGPEISKTLQVKVKEMINNEDWDFGDRLQETLEEHFPTLIKEIMDDSNLKTDILKKIKEEIESRIEELLGEEINNDSDIVMEPIKERLNSWLAAEFDNPESEFRQKIIEALKDKALQAIEE